MSKMVKVNKGNQGWGGPLFLQCEGRKNKVVSITGGGIDNLTAYIAELIGAEAIDGFKEPTNDDEIICAVINCGGTLRCGVYPQKGIMTINLHAIGPSGPLKDHIVEGLYVSGVKKENIELLTDGNDVHQKDERQEDAIVPYNQDEEAEDEQDKFVSSQDRKQSEDKSNPIFDFMSVLGEKVGSIISMFYEAGKKTIDLLLTTIIPFMAFISILVGFVNYTGIGKGIAQLLTPLGSSLWGLLIIAIICSFPILSPVLGPGAAVAQVVGALVGTQIAAGSIPPQFALPALFAIDAQVAGDFFPVGLSLMDAKPKTIKYATPAFLIQKQITGPISVIIAYLFSIGLY